MSFSREKQRGVYQSKVTSSLACIHGRVAKHTTVKWPIGQALHAAIEIVGLKHQAYERRL